ncbi:MAG: toxin-antitoxin system HicB family antitoxin [Gemmatimonadetes bacterium]|nr:toxin-antitoxin system HicB family antitoxin [Gemmatimonadota bacterium]
MMLDAKYPVEVFWVEEDGAYFAISPALGNGVSAYGDTPEEAITEFGVVLDLVLESYKEHGVEPPAPTASGKLSLRLPKSLHAQLARQAESENVSLNMLLVSMLAASAGRKAAAKK